MSPTGKAVHKISKIGILFFFYLLILQFADVCNHGKKNISIALSPYHNSSLIKSSFTGDLTYLSPI